VRAAGLVINYAQVGFLLSTDSLSPKLENLNPIQGFKKIFSRKALFELAKALFKIILVGAVTYGFIRSRLDSFLSFVYTTPAGLFAGFSREIYNLTLRVGVIFISLAVLDYLYQRYEFMKSMRMTKQEVKEEFKQLEGDPLIKSKLREKQRSMAGRRMMQEVPKATVVVTNPTDIAVALKYSEGETAAPKIVAKGAALIAARIREVAKEHGVPVVENKVVARFLYRHVEIGREIPMELYQAVAEILALVYESKKRSR
jgi:flagellar biosynthetic protein FlhB